jgi:hypothetical protein
VTTDTPGAGRRFWRGLNRGRLAFRRWRRGRPFWGGLFLILGGVQLFLSGQLSVLGEVAISFGPEGFLQILLPVVLLLCGVLVWVTPQHRYFYSIIGTLTAVYSLLGLNLGGWFLGMLLGIIGGALGFSWTSVTPAPAEPPEPRPEPDERPEPDQRPEPDERLEPDERPTVDLTGPLADQPPGPEQTAPVRAPRQEPRAYVGVLLPILLAAGLAAPQSVPAQICLPLLCPDPSESPAPDPDPEPEPGPSLPGLPGLPTPELPPIPDPTAPGEEPTPTPTPTPSLSPLPTPPPTEEPLVAAQPGLMTADRLDQENFLFEGIAELNTADGPVEVMQFSFSRATATNFTLTTSGGDATATVTADPLVLAGDVTFYTSRFTGRLLGTLPLELTPNSPLADLLQLVDIPLPVFFTDVNLDLVFTHGAELTAEGFSLGVQT